MGEVTRQIIALVTGVLSGTIMIAMLVVIPQVKRRSSVVRSGNSALDAAPALIAPLIAVMTSFFFGAIALVVYYALDRAYLIWFGVTEILWYLIGFSLYALRKIVREKQLRETL